MALSFFRRAEKTQDGKVEAPKKPKEISDTGLCRFEKCDSAEANEYFESLDQGMVNISNQLANYTDKLAQDGLIKENPENGMYLGKNGKYISGNSDLEGKMNGHPLRDGIYNLGEFISREGLSDELGNPDAEAGEKFTRDILNKILVQRDFKQEDFSKIQETLAIKSRINKVAKDFIKQDSNFGSWQANQAEVDAFYQQITAPEVAKLEHIIAQHDLDNAREEIKKEGDGNQAKEEGNAPKNEDDDEMQKLAHQRLDQLKNRADETISSNPEIKSKMEDFKLQKFIEANPEIFKQYKGKAQEEFHLFFVKNELPENITQDKVKIRFQGEVKEEANRIEAQWGLGKDGARDPMFFHRILQPFGNQGDIKFENGAMVKDI